MRFQRPLRFALVALAAAASFGWNASRVSAGGLTTNAAAASPTQIQVSWQWWEDPSNPTGHPEWVGYDLYRRAGGANCGAPTERLNAAIIARVPGQDQNLSFLDTTPASGTPYSYDVRLVDANREQLFLLAPACWPPCSPPAWAMCPEFSAPLIEGTVEDWGWAVFIIRCEGSCYGGFYISNPQANALRPYAGTGQPVRVYGVASCGSVEGCGMSLDHFELGGCVVTPVRRTTWGALKSHYR